MSAECLLCEELRGEVEEDVLVCKDCQEWLYVAGIEKREAA
jgi:uncharacterized protein YbaR (Trm112 family)